MLSDQAPEAPGLRREAGAALGPGWPGRLALPIVHDLQVLGLGAALLVLSGAGAVLAGWLLGVPRLADPAATGHAVKANAALALFCLAGGLMAVRRRPGARWSRACAVGAGGVACLVGLVTLAEYGLDWSSPAFDELLFRDVSARPGRFPGRPAAHAAFALLCLGIAVVIPEAAGRRGRLARDVSALAALGIGAFALVGTVTGSTVLVSVGRSYAIPPLSAILIMAAAVACQLTLPPGLSAAHRLADADAGGLLLRRLGPVIVGISLLAGGVHQALHEHLQGPSAGWVISAGAMLVLGLVVWRTADRLDAVDLARESEAHKARMLLASLTDSVVVIDEAGVCVSAYGPPWAGAGDIPVTGRLFAEVGVSADAGVCSEAVRRALSGEAATYQSSTEEPARHYSVSLSPVRSGAATGAVAVARDVTHLKQAEVAARVAGRRYESLFAGAAEGIARTSRDGAILLANAAMARMLGYDSPEELIESVPDAGALYVRAGERDRLLARVVSGDNLGRTEVEMRRRDGTTIWVRVSSVAATVREGDPGGVEVIVEDVTAARLANEELQSTRERLHVAFHDSPQGQMVLAAEARLPIVEVNAAAEEMLGCSGDDLLGTDFWSGVHPDDRAMEQGHLDACGTGGQRAVTYRTRRQRPGAGWFPVDVSASLVRGAGGAPLYFIVVIDDVSARLRAEEACDAAADLVAQQARVATDLARLAQMAIDGGEIDDLLPAVAATTRTALGAEIAGFLRMQEDGSLRIAALSKATGDPSAFIGQTIEPGTIAYATLGSGSAVLVEDWDSERRFSRPSTIRAANVRSSLSVAVRHGGQTFGVMGAHSVERRTFSTTQVAFLESVASLVALMMARGEAAQALEQSERTVRALVDNAPTAIHLVAPDGRFLLVNNEFGRVFGVEEATIVGRTRNEVPALAGESAEAHRRAEVAALASGAALSHEQVASLDDGLHTYICVKFPVLDGVGKAIAVGGIATDVTPLRRAQEETERAWHETILRLAKAVEYRDEETGDHIERMASYCELIARGIGLDPRRAAMIRSAALMHDAGKVAVPDRILRKRGALTADERRVIENHPVVAHELLAGSGSELLDLAADIALTHHERYDGTGYPRGLSGDAIPIEGRIAAVADVYDALVTDRVYRKALPISEVAAMMRSEAGRHFDPAVLDALMTQLPAAAAIAARSVR